MARRRQMTIAIANGKKSKYVYLEMLKSNGAQAFSTHHLTLVLLLELQDRFQRKEQKG
jgi:hypothetical protein